MCSVYGDTVLDPFLGTGTPSFAAMVAGRNSVGYELDEEFVRLFKRRADDVPEYSRETFKKRLDDHEEFVEERLSEGKDFKYQADNYDFPVTTKQEKPIQCYAVSDVPEIEEEYAVSHTPCRGYCGRDRGKQTRWRSRFTFWLLTAFVAPETA
ncbi:DNA methyltransferase [Haloplanus salilacus]|uniref:DNA methyltransferase n=1 Tax=Haloplanus salilacus TaxID=2949994 RepID=UPI0030CEF1F6